MKKSFRVKTEREFQKVFSEGKSCANRRFVVYRLDPDGQKHFRVGLSVGKKIGNAVTRNAVKRKVRASLQELAPNLLPLDFIVIARPGVEKLAYAEVRSNLEHVLKLAKIIE